VACLIAAAVCVAGGLLAAATLRGVRRRVTVPAEPAPVHYHCGLDAPPLRQPEEVRAPA
jgi:hypothetical protein